MKDPEPYVAFDLEIATDFPDDGNWHAVRPMGISCAATYTSDGVGRVWHAPALDVDVPYPERMTPPQVQQMVAYMLDYVNHGFKIVTWNGLGFDFDVLAEEAEDPQWQRIIELMAWDAHVDPFFTMTCALGYGIGLETAAKGLKVGGKTEGMSGALAPQMWREGRESQDKVLAYVAQDAQATANVYEALAARGELPWITKGNRRRVWGCGDLALMTVRQAVTLPQPDTSWMTAPRARSSFYGWMGQVPQQ